MLRHFILFKLRFVVLVSCLVVIISSFLHAQTVVEITADTNNFKESYDAAVPVSGSTIVGVRLGEAEGNVSVKNTQLALSTAKNICVRVVTRDGRFSASNIYKVSGPLSGVDRARLSPVTLKYANALSQYKTDDLALSAFPASNGRCRPGKTAFLPQLASLQPPRRNLTILINSRGRYSELVVNNGKQKVRCQPLSQGSLLAFDKKCQVDAGLLAKGRNDFTLLLDDGFGVEPLSFAVLLPPEH